ARPAGWVEVNVELDLDKAEKLPRVTDNRLPESSRTPGRNDLEGLWASAQAARFAALEAQSPEFTFYGFARRATGRKYGVPVPSLRMQGWGRDDFPNEHVRLYETTTGAAAVAESLQLQRMLTQDSRDKGERKIDIKKVAGIDIAQHPW